MRAQVMASQFSMESLGRRLQEAEDRQRQLLEQLASVVLPPIGTGRGQSESSNGAGIRRVYLPMIIENIVFEHKRFKSEGRLRTWAHMKIVPAGKTVCSRRQSRDCKVVTYEDRIDWEIIVGAAIEAGNLGGKGLDVQDLREALFPPQLYPHQWI
ncbi:hypothetical protein CFE70_005848 [Pyrenophora teres f. teres 0-1]